jgi:outer membrane receptor protein involved in Fe transport
MKNYLLLLLLIFGVGQFVQAQNAKLTGLVTDKKGEKLAGANVYIKELEKGTATDLNGVFTLEKLIPGNYTLVVSFISYDKKSEQIILTEGSNKHDVILSQKDIMLEGLIVTAQKREQSIKEIPTAVTSIDGKFFEKSGITELDALSEYVPGMQVQLQSPNNPGFVIRGITSDDGASNVEPRVSVFQDGVSISKSRGSVVEVYDMERVEVLKGPQGTLFGRGAQIGAVHFIQNKAHNNTSGAFTAGYGNYNYTHFEGFFNTPIVKDKLFARVAGIYKKREGFIENLSGGNLNGKDTKAFRVSLRYKPEAMTTIDLIYNYQNDTPPGTSFKSGSYAPIGGDTNPWTYADLEAGEDLGLDRTVWGTTLIARHTFSENFSLTSTTAYREFDSYEKFDADGTAAPALLMAEDAFGKQFSEEVRVNFKINDKFEGFGGVSYFFEDGFANVPLWTNEQSLAVLMSNLSSLTTTINSSVLSPINTALSAYGLPDMEMSSTPMLTNGTPNYVSNLAGLISNSSNLAYIASAYPTIYYMFMQSLQEEHTESYTNYGKNSAYEFFVDGTYHVSDKFKVTGGLRFTFEDIESGYKVDGDGAGTLGFARSAGTNDLFMPTDGKLTAGDTYFSMVGRLALNYSLTDNNDVYFNFSRGRRPNVIQFSMEANDDGTYTSSYEVEKLNDEIVWSYEVGTKGLSSAGNLYYDLAAFYYDYTDFQTSAVNESLQYVTKDAGDATAFGFEASLKWQINKVLNVFGNYGFIDASFDDEDADGNAQEYAGNTFRLTPKHSFALGCNISVPLNQNISIFFRPAYNYKSKVYFEEDNEENISQDAYGLLNLRAGLNVQNFRLDFFMTNATDEKYIIDAGNTGNSFGIPTYIAGAPRFFGAEMKFTF